MPWRLARYCPRFSLERLTGQPPKPASSSVRRPRARSRSTLSRQLNEPRVRFPSGSGRRVEGNEQNEVGQGGVSQDGEMNPLLIRDARGTRSETTFSPSGPTLPTSVVRCTTVGRHIDDSAPALPTHRGYDRFAACPHSSSHVHGHHPIPLSVPDLVERSECRQHAQAGPARPVVSAGALPIQQGSRSARRRHP
jgi:hypothetical protein